MSIDGKMCRVCLAPQRTSSFNYLFGNNGLMAFQVFQLTGLKILEFDGCPALICPKCTIDLRRAMDFRSSILLSNERFKQIYSLCRFKDFDNTCLTEDEYEIAVKSEPNDEVNALSMDFSEFFSMPEENFQNPVRAEVFIQEASVKKELLEDPFKTDDIDEFLKDQILKAIKEEPCGSSSAEINEFCFDDLSEDLLLILDGDNRDDDDSSEDEKPLPMPEIKRRGRKESLQTFLCTVCGYKSCSELDRQEHIATTHNKKKRKRTYMHVVGDRDWMCSYCGRNFQTKYDSIQHRKSEHKEEEESCICRFCGKQFSQSLHLRIHIKFTHLEKRFMCPKCGLTFGNPEAFKAHMKLENNERNFVCEICSSTFILRHQLVYHMRKHTGDRRFACDYCGFRFLTKTMLKKHIAVVHLKIRPFQCMTCNQTFSMKHHLKGHMNRVHLQLYPQ